MNLVILSVVFWFEAVNCINILYIDDVISASHQLWNYRIAEKLLKKNYNITLIGPRTIKPLENVNFTMLELTDIYTSVNENKLLDPEYLQSLSSFENIHFLQRYFTCTCKDSLKAPDLKKLLDYPKDFKFNLVIAELSGGLCLLPLIQRFNYPPTIGVVPALLPIFSSEDFGNLINPSFQPFYASNFLNKMSFTERLENFIYTYYEYFVRYWHYMPQWNSLAKETFGEDTEDIQTIQKHIPVLLANLMLGFHYSQPLTPNIIPVGGLHIRTPKGLPGDLQEIYDKAENGVVFFSLGTNIRTNELDVDKIGMFKETFGRLNVTVIWKIDFQLKDCPGNVYLKKFLPQNEILAHPKTRAFISHCGGLSTMESVHHGVPIIGIPFMVDQHFLSALIENRELGVKLKYDTLTTNEFYEAIQKVLNNEIYADNVRKLSKLVRDQTETPIERALFWIEWTMRNNGSNLYNPQSRNMSYISSLCLDIYLFILVLITGCLLGLNYVIKKAYLILSAWCKAPTHHSSKVKTN